ncbi:MAG TPA: OsmC family peroxiredoxin [Campylobacterales bacterium]|nr:OsmC family peroxiredoxin [Campylobacterales bacterium]HIO70752.1 OsmC family peroxiredoxin [Campylobacterales bacterium]
MKVSISHKEGYDSESMVFEAKTSKSSFEIRPSTISPVEYFASGMVACSATDMVMLPKQQGYSISHLNIEADIVRNETHPKKFNEIHLIYSFNSDADDLIARRWVLSTIETYCSTLNTVRGVSKISFSIVHNGKVIADRDEVVSGENNTILESNGNIPDIGGACEA